MSPSALDVLRSLHHHCTGAGLPPPAALIGSWYGADAVIAPSVEIVAGLAPPDDPDRFWFGYLGFPVNASKAPFPTAAGGLVDGVLLLRDGQWSWTDVTGLSGNPADPPTLSLAFHTSHTRIVKVGHSATASVTWSDTA